MKPAASSATPSKGTDDTVTVKGLEKPVEPYHIWD
jgi:hypothetical protein